MVKVSRERVLALCEALGYKTARQWNRKRMRRKLGELAASAQENEIGVEDDDSLNRLLRKIVEADGDVELIDGEVAEEDEVEADHRDEEAPANETGVEGGEDVVELEPIKVEKKKKRRPGGKKKDDETTKKSEKKLTRLEAVVRVLSESDEPLSAEEIVDVVRERKYWIDMPGASRTPAVISVIIKSEIARKGTGARFRIVGKGFVLQ